MASISSPVMVRVSTIRFVQAILAISMDDFPLEMPKAELHLHLEGAVEAETLHELDPATPLEELRALYRYPDFNAFLKTFGAVVTRLARPEDYALVTRRPIG